MTLLWTIFQRVLIALSIASLILLYCLEKIAGRLEKLTSWFKQRLKSNIKTFNKRPTIDDQQERN